MLLHETMYIGCESDEIAEIGNSELLKFDTSTAVAHATVQSRLNGVYFNAHYAQKLGSKKPYKVSIVWKTKWLKWKRKETDSEDVYTRLKWYIHNMVCPKNGIIFSVYVAENSDEIGEKVAWAINTLWPLKRQCKPLNKYVTMQIIEPELYSLNRLESHKQSPERKRHVEYYEKLLHEEKEYTDTIKSYCSFNDFDIKYIDYTMPYDEVYELLLGSNIHFTYPGSSMYLAVACKTITIALHPITRVEDSNKKIDYGYYDPYTRKVNYDGWFRPYTRYGLITNGPQRIQQYIPDLNAAVQMGINNIIDVANVRTLLSELENIN